VGDAGGEAEGEREGEAGRGAGGPNSHASSAFGKEIFAARGIIIVGEFEIY